MTEPADARRPGDAGNARADVRTAWALVAGQFLLIALIVLLGGGAAWPVPSWLDRLAWVGMVLGVVVMIVGAIRLGRGLTAAPLPNAHAQLRTGGLYRWVRHPIYAGLLLFAIAHTVASASHVQVVLCLLLAALISVKARWEERRLADRFAGYTAYAARTPRYLPFGPVPRSPR
jgi:protein-S-isoprenylcysteine O-methyltransferase Ste14